MAAVAMLHRVGCRLGVAALVWATPGGLRAQGPDSARAGRWLDAARSTLDSSNDSLRRPIALGYASLRRGADALALDPGTPVILALACAELQSGDTAAAETALRQEREIETRGWLQARLVNFRALSWGNVRPSPATVAAASAAADGIESPAPRVSAELRLASALTAIHDTSGAQARLAAARIAYAQVTDSLRRVDQGMSIAWMEGTMGDPAQSLRLVHQLSHGMERTAALSGIAKLLRGRGLDPGPWLLEAESLAVAERRPAMRRSALDQVIAGYDSVADSITIRRLRALRPLPRPAPRSNLDRARERLAAGDTAGAFRLAATYPDPRRLGHRAAALKRFGWDLLEGPGGGLWRERAFRQGIVEARRVQDPGIRAMLLYDLAYILTTLGDNATPGRDPRLREAETVAGELAPTSRIEMLQAVADGWARRSDDEFHRLLGLMPTRADSTRLLNRVLWQMNYAMQGSREVDSVRQTARDRLTELTAGATLARGAGRPGVPALGLGRLLAQITLPEDAGLLLGLLRAKVPGDTLRLEQWAREQPTALERAVAFQSLATDAMFDGRIASGWSGCLRD